MGVKYQPPGWKVLGATAIVALVASLSFTLSKPVALRVDGQQLVSDVPPISTPKGTVFVPLRPFGTAIGAETRYDRKTGEIVVQRGDQSLEVHIGSKNARLDGLPITLAQAPFRVRGRTMVGLDAVRQAFGMHAHINAATASIDLDTPGLASPTL